MSDPRDAWAIEPHPLPADELAPDFQATPYVDPWNSILERIANADPDTMRKLANWGTGDPDAG